MSPPEDPALPTTHDLSLAARQQRGRIWIDGCFDFAHHGHAGAMLQARQLGTALYVGVHSDEAITVNKGPPVMALDERIAAVDACRWATQSVPYAPYVTELAYIDQYDTQYVVHGDDITADADGNDCYRYVKQAGRFLVVKRTPGISTTDLVARMLTEPAKNNETKRLPYHVHSLPAVLAGSESCASGSGPDLATRITAYATDSSGLAPGVPVWNWSPTEWTTLVPGPRPKPGQRLVYVDGGWDLFCSGHIAFLQAVFEAEERRARENGWFDEQQRTQRVKLTGQDYPPAYVVAGVHTDAEVHEAKGGVFPVMSIFERGLCVLQCRYISALLFSAPRYLSRGFLSSFSHAAGGAGDAAAGGFQDKASPDIVYHGPTPNSTSIPAPYVDADAMGIFGRIDAHAWQDVHAETIVQRILDSRARFEERQRIKGVKAVGEEEIRGREGEGGKEENGHAG